jgi:hypothetical protein
VQAQLPVSALLSQALIAVALEYEQAGAGSWRLPTLEMRSNLLRCLEVGSVPEAALPALTRLSRRAVRARVGRAQRQRWIEVVSGRAGNRSAVLALTGRGRRARDAWPGVEAAVDRRWLRRVGEDAATALRASVQSVVAGLELELSHFPAGYGPADASITGGHGRDWKPVARAEGDTVSDLSLSALLSQALVAYTMEYEANARVPLALNVNVLQWLDTDRGRPLAAVPAQGAVGTLERHGLVQTFSAEDGPGGLWVRLTDRGRRARAGYGQRIKLIDQQWQARYGPGLRTALEGVVDGLDLPYHPIGVFAPVGSTS